MPSSARGTFSGPRRWTACGYRTVSYTHLSQRAAAQRALCVHAGGGILKALQVAQQHGCICHQGVAKGCLLYTSHHTALALNEFQHHGAGGAVHNYFGPFNEGFLYAPAGDIEALEDLVDRTTCAVMLELIQGEGCLLYTSRCV